MKTDKKRVEGVEWDEAQLKDLLVRYSNDDSHSDYNCLYRAYTRLNADAFKHFVRLFVQEGGSIDAKNDQGQTLAELLATHAKASDYRNILIQQTPLQ